MMKMMIRAMIVSLCLGGVAVSVPAFAQDAPVKVKKKADKKADKKRKDIRKLLEITGSKAMLEPMVDQMFMAMKNGYPDVPEKKWKELRGKVTLDQLFRDIEDIYAEEFTDEEISALVTFYESPIGKKALAKMPVIMQKSQMLGQQWGMGVAQMVQDDLKKSGHLK